MKMMLLTKLKTVACVILAVMLLGGLTTWVGTSFADLGGTDEESKTKTQAARSEKEVVSAPAREETKATEKVIDLGSRTCE